MATLTQRLGSALGIKSLTSAPFGLTDVAAYRQAKISGRDDPHYSDIMAADPSVTPASANGLSAVFASVRLISEAVGSMPGGIYKRDTDNPKRFIPAPNHPMNSVLQETPNADIHSSNFFEFSAAAGELCGNAFARKIPGTRGRFTLEMVERPDLVHVTRERNTGRRRYRWTQEGRSYDLYEEDVLHMRGAMATPMGGVSTLTACRQIFASALSEQNAQTALHRNGSRPSGVLKTERPLTKEQRDELEKRFQERYAGAMKSGRPLLLDNAMDWQAISLTPEDMQMLEARKFSVEEIARIFGVPPHMIGHTTASTSFGKGLAEMARGFNKFSLRPRTNRLEKDLTFQLLTPADRAAGYVVKFSYEEMMDLDPEARSKYYASMLAAGVMTINEVRARNNLPPVPGGDEVRIQKQNAPIRETESETGGQS